MVSYLIGHLKVNKLDDRIRWLNSHTDEYLRILNEMDEQEDGILYSLHGTSQ